MQETRRAAWPDLDASTAVTLPSGYTIHLRQELDAETYYLLGDILVELASITADDSPLSLRDRRARQRALNREMALVWLVGWDILPRDARPGEAPMPITDDALQMLDLDIRQEVDDAIGAHQEPYIARVVEIFAGAPKGKAAASAQAGRGATKSSASASARTRRPTSSRAGRSAGTP